MRPIKLSRAAEKDERLKDRQSDLIRARLREHIECSPVRWSYTRPGQSPYPRSDVRADCRRCSIARATGRGMNARPGSTVLVARHCVSEFSG